MTSQGGQVGSSQSTSSALEAQETEESMDQNLKKIISRNPNSQLQWKAMKTQKLLQRQSESAQLHSASDFTDDEYVDAAKTFFMNLGYQAKHIADISASNLSEIELKAIVQCDQITEFIAEQARELLEMKRKRERKMQDGVAEENQGTIFDASRS